MGISQAAMLYILLCSSSQVSALPTPRMSEEEMTQAAEVVVEGEIVCVTLTKRWIGDRPGIDTGYESGEFESQLLVSKTLKGKYKVNQTIRYFVGAYMQGKWDAAPPMGFVYEGTKDAITPGTRLRAYLKWNAENKRYERVHFNSGFVVLESSDHAYPKSVGVPSRTRNKAATQSVAGDGKPAPPR